MLSNIQKRSIELPEDGEFNNICNFCDVYTCSGILNPLTVIKRKRYYIVSISRLKWVPFFVKMLLAIRPKYRQIAFNTVLSRLTLGIISSFAVYS